MMIPSMASPAISPPAIFTAGGARSGRGRNIVEFACVDQATEDVPMNGGRKQMARWSVVRRWQHASVAQFLTDGLE